MNNLVFSPTPSTTPTCSTLSTPSTCSTPSTKIILVRHARTTYNEQGRYQGSSDESVLTKTGHQAAYQTGLALKQFTFDAIYTSPLTRVQQTTQEIMAALGDTNDNLPSVFIEPKLTEINMSAWQGLFYQEVKEKFPEAYRCWQENPHLFTFNSFSFPVLELFKQAQEFWREILDKHRGQTILIVAHGGTNRALISTAIGLNPEDYHSLQQSNCGISCLEFSSNNSNHGQLKFLNFTEHLGENLPKLKAGKRGWRWLLLSDRVTGISLKYSCIPKLVDQELINLILTDGSQESESLAINLIQYSKKTIHLSLAKEYFLDNWQETIFTRQKRNYSANEANLFTGLIIVKENILCQMLQKTLGITTTLRTRNHLTIIHYPHANRRSILQCLVPLRISNKAIS